jgi:uncharacterized protein (TIGR03435 family)
VLCRADRDALANATHRIVVDKTGLTGRYDFVLDWTPDIQRPADASSDGTSLASAGPTIFTAVQEQLGLRLESGKAPVDVLVIDHVDRPSAN